MQFFYALICFLGSLIGVSMGIFVGSLGKMKEGVKIGMILINKIRSYNIVLRGVMNALNSGSFYILLIILRIIIALSIVLFWMRNLLN